MKSKQDPYENAYPENWKINEAIDKEIDRMTDEIENYLNLARALGIEKFILENLELERKKDGKEIQKSK